MGWIKAEPNTDYPQALGIEYRDNIRYVNLPEQAQPVQSQPQPVPTPEPEPNKTEKKK